MWGGYLSTNNFTLQPQSLLTVRCVLVRKKIHTNVIVRKRRALGSEPRQMAFCLVWQQLVMGWGGRIWATGAISINVLAPCSSSSSSRSSVRSLGRSERLRYFITAPTATPAPCQSRGHRGTCSLDPCMASRQNDRCQTMAELAAAAGPRGCTVRAGCVVYPTDGRSRCRVDRDRRRRR